jgi:5-methylcytosine-specific restriction protein A
MPDPNDPASGPISSPTPVGEGERASPLERDRFLSEDRILRLDRTLWPLLGEPGILRPEYEVQRSTRWASVRDAFLEVHNECAVCGGGRFLEVHHIKPYHLFPEKELDIGNLIVLCDSPARRCHFVFGHLMDWRCYDPQIRNTARMMRGMIDRSRERLRRES